MKNRSNIIIKHFSTTVSGVLIVIACIALGMGLMWVMLNYETVFRSTPDPGWGWYAVAALVIALAAAMFSKHRTESKERR
ncbi:hypothetical protein ACFL17_06900 [Pseudomonadota bacterium]